MLENQKTPLVSVIMIFLNGEKFIREAIDSVLNQTYSNWELIFVDDGSEDASTRITLQYVQQHPGKMRYVEHVGHQNQGMSASRNLGIKRSQGELIAFLDADDVYLPEKLAREVSHLLAHPTASMVYGTTQYWYSWTGQAEDAHRDGLRLVGVQTDQLYQPPEILIRFLQNKAHTPATCSVLLRRDAIGKIGGFEQSFSGMYEDQVFFHKFCLHEPVYIESGSYSRYRQHPDSHCRINQKNGNWDPGSGPSPARAVFLQWLKGYFTEQNVTDPRIWRLLRKELWPYQHPKLNLPRYVIYRLKNGLSMKMRSLVSGKGRIVRE